MTEASRPSSLLAPHLTPVQKASLISGEARAEVAGRLWRAALGVAEAKDEGASTAARGASLIGEGPSAGLDRLLALLGPRPGAATTEGPAPVVAAASPDPSCAAEDSLAAGVSLRNGANARYAVMLENAAGRTGIPVAALAAIVDAEADKGADGSWQPYSRNPRSSAAGLGQFLKGSWEGEAERAGTWLNESARANGWLDAQGRVRPESRGALLALRYDPKAAIETVSDYASANLETLRRAGVRIGDGVSDLARAAYLGHHLGIGDARRFLNGGLEPERARRLLGAQVGGADAERRIAQAGGAVAAHRSWLLGYIDRHVRPDRFA
ncbi:MAG TPA: peptidoglycan-binding protein [Novosphingobium sp.]|nr:peptidoglycan-binding protein [Novosphingobium sp.]